ncbi:hypothetical protein BT69DRAFT_1276152 [Atractiella rhizophila]|nr:hypothetical protein BT69DRAFT_1276152 [Atractiella rhizophila]
MEALKERDFLVLELRARLEEEDALEKDVLDSFRNFMSGIDLNLLDSMDDEVLSYEQWNKQLKRIWLQKQASRRFLEMAWTLDDPTERSEADLRRLEHSCDQAKSTLQDAKNNSRELQVALKTETRRLEEALNKLLLTHDDIQQIHNGIKQLQEWKDSLEQHRAQYNSRKHDLDMMKQEVAKVHRQLREEKATAVGKKGRETLSVHKMERNATWM